MCADELFLKCLVASLRNKHCLLDSDVAKLANKYNIVKYCALLNKYLAASSSPLIRKSRNNRVFFLTKRGRELDLFAAEFEISNDVKSMLSFKKVAYYNKQSNVESISIDVVI